MRNKTQKVYPISECETDHSDTSSTSIDTQNSEDEFIQFTILRIIYKHLNFNYNDKIRLVKLNDPLGMTYGFKNEIDISYNGIISTHRSHNSDIWKPQLINENDHLGWFVFIKK